MYKTLEIRMPDLRIVALIEAFNKRYTISFAEDELIKDSLSKILDAGIDAIIPLGKKEIIINSHPCDSDFLQRIAQYLMLSFNYICFYKVSDNLQPRIQDTSNYHELQIEQHEMILKDLWEKLVAVTSKSTSFEGATIASIQRQSTVGSPFDWIA